MPLRSVFRKSLWDERRTLVVWLGAFAGLVAMYVAVYPSVRGNSSFAKLIEEMPDAYKALFTASGGADFTTASGYLNTELLTFMAPLLVLLHTVGSGAAAVAGEEDRRTLDLLLANPVSRKAVVVQKFAAITVTTGAILAGLWVALQIEGRFVDMEIPLLNGAAALAQLGLLGLEFGALALLVGALTGHPTMSKVVASVAAVGAYLLNGLAPLVSWLKPLRKLSPFYQYIGHDPLGRGLSIAGVVTQLTSVGVLVAVAAAAFARRDVLA